MTRSRRVLLVALAAFVGCGGGSSSDGEKASATTAAVPTHAIEIDTIRAKVAARGLPALSAQPNRFLSDMWGVQRLRDDVTAEFILASLVPHAASVATDRGDGTLRLLFHDGWEAAFHLPGSYEIRQPRDPEADDDADSETAGRGASFVVVENATSSEDEGPFLEALWGAFADNGGLEAFLPLNPHEVEEQTAQSLLAAADPGSRATELGGFDAFLEEERAVYILPDPVHGDLDRYEMLLEMVRDPGVDWVAIEMLSITQQDALQTFLRGEVDDELLRAAEAEILAYYESNWNYQFGTTASPRENHYFRVLELARDLGKGAYALDAGVDYMMFRYSEFPLGATTRNVIWADQLPRDGRGVVFGGSAHFNLGEPGTFQDFLARRRPELPIYHHYVDRPPG